MDEKVSKRKGNHDSISEHKKKKIRRRSGSDCLEEISSPTSSKLIGDIDNKAGYSHSEGDVKCRKRELKKNKKEKKHKHKDKRLKKKKKIKLKKHKRKTKGGESEDEGKQRNESGIEPMPATTEPPIGKRIMAPMTKEQYEKQQSTMKHVFDPETGRYRLIKGDGEVMEEIVSHSKHRDINKATKGDGATFQKMLGLG